MLFKPRFSRFDKLFTEALNIKLEHVIYSDQMRSHHAEDETREVLSSTLAGNVILP